jgi:integrase
MGRVNFLKQIKEDGRWRLISIPRKPNGRFNWKALPEGRYFIEWYEAGKRKRQAAGHTVSQVREAARRKKHDLEAKELGVKSFETPEKTTKEIPLHSAKKEYLRIVEGLKKPNTLRKYRAVLNRFVEFLPDKSTAQSISNEDLDGFMVHLKQGRGLSNNTVIHNMVIVAQFLKKQGRGGLTRNLDMPTKITRLAEEYTDEELRKFFSECDVREHTLFLTFLLTGFREQEVVYLFWSDINFNLSTIRVKAKPDHQFFPKRWEEREVPVRSQLIDELKRHERLYRSPFVFPSPRGNRELHMLDKAKDIAAAASLVSKSFNLKKFRSTFATRMLRAGFDVRTVQYWMGHKSLETTMRYLSPATNIRERLENLSGIFDEI